MSPFKSKAQEKYFFANEGKDGITKGMPEEWASKTDYKSLPNKIGEKKNVKLKIDKPSIR